MPLPILRAALDAWPTTQFMQVYGMTEMCGVATILDDAAHRDEAHPERLVSAGRPIDGVELRVVDPATGRDVEAGTAGENVYSPEVERVLAEHPDVLELAVIGVPDPKWGEAVKAVVVLKEGATSTADDLRTFARERLAHYKVPSSFDVLGELPRNPSGKILERELRKPYWAESGRQV